MTRCPSDLELERLVREPDGRGASHLFTCARCSARVAELRRLDEEFAREVFPATVDAVLAGASRPLRARAQWLVPAAAAAALLAIAGGVWWSRSGEGRSDPEGGGPIDLVAFAGTEVGAVSDGQRIPAAAGLHFEVRPPRTCTLFIASADAAGTVTRVYPPKAMTGTEGLPVEAGRVVAVQAPAPAARRVGPERYFALCGCGDDPIHWKDVDRAVRGIGAGPEQIRAARGVSGLPDDTLQATLLVEREE